MGRPTLYNEGMINKAEKYQKDHLEEGDHVPSIEGLALFLGVQKKTLYNWADEHEEFLHTLEKVKLRQAKMLINGGLIGDYNSTITKLMLHNHGYSDKQEIDHNVTVNIGEEWKGI